MQLITKNQNFRKLVPESMHAKTLACKNHLKSPTQFWKFFKNRPMNQNPNCSTLNQELWAIKCTLSRAKMHANLAKPN